MINYSWLDKQLHAITLSTKFIFFMSLAVSFKADAAVSLYSQLRQRIEEQDSGEITEYQVFSSIKTRSPTPIPKAPPEAPSPIITVGFFIKSLWS